MRKHTLLWIALVALVFFNGCGTAELSRADRLLEKGYYREARYRYEKYLRTHPEQFRAHYGLAMSFCAEALQRTELGLGVPEHWYLPVYHMNEAFKAGAGEKARKNLAIFHFNLGASYHRLKRFDDAIQMLEQSVDLDSMVLKAHNLLGAIYHQRGNLGQAQRCYQAVLDIEPHYAMAHFNLGAVFWARGDFDAAVTYFQAAVSHAPHNGHFLLWLEKARQQQEAPAYESK